MAAADPEAPPSSSGSSSGTPTASVDECSDEHTPILWCSGDAPDSTALHNFGGSWFLFSDGAARPAYEHGTPAGASVYLYYLESDAQAPRWVIGPEPDERNGWAYADSSAPCPEDIVEPWKAYDQEAGAWAEARLAFSARVSAPIGYDESGDEHEAAHEASHVADALPAAKKATKKKAKGTTAAKAKKGVEGAKGRAKKAAPPAAKKAKAK